MFDCDELVERLASRGVRTSVREFVAREADGGERRSDDVEIALPNGRTIFVGLIDTERRALGLRVVEPATWCMKELSSAESADSEVARECAPVPTKRRNAGVNLKLRAKKRGKP